MRSWILTATPLAVLFFACLPASAYGDEPVSEEIQSEASSVSEELAKQELKRMYDEYFEVDSDIPGASSESTSNGGADGDKVYRYKGMDEGSFFGVTMPRRSFNNIKYPY